ncbi:MAG: RsmD family RNA methyltransferase [Bacteroidales bacterium]|nr:RsmD family RNA methyltransferase [Bacteroidales bacterium]
MRIISGIFRGKRIHPPGNFKARPTTDFAKENLFNILIHQYDLEEMDVLDLFSGTGSISYEFASRGARSVLAVEMAPSHFRFIQETGRSMKMEQLSVIMADVFKFLRKPVLSFDIIFADPPYDHPGLAGLPDLVLSTKILNKEGLFILEHPGNFSFTAHPRFQQHRKYGGVNFSFFS